MSGTTTLSEHFQYAGGQLSQVTALTATLNGSGQVTSSGQYTDSYVYGPMGEPLEFLRQQNGTTNRYWYVLDGHVTVARRSLPNGVAAQLQPYGWAASHYRRAYCDLPGRDIGRSAWAALKARPLQ